MKRAFVLILLVAVFGCRRTEDDAKPVSSEQRDATDVTLQPPPPSEVCPPDVVTVPPSPLPDYVARLASAELYLRVIGDAGPELVVAPADDLAVVHAYPTGRIRGPRVDGTRATILAAKRTYRINEEIRVIHVVEVDEPGHEVFVMGPKPITGEWLDDKLVTEPVATWGAFTMGVYDGAVMKSPWADSNYEITHYAIATPGLHRLQWRAGSVLSNVLCVRVIGA